MIAGETVLLESLDLDALPQGALTAAWLPMLEDGMGEPLRLPLLVARGARPGPTVGITAVVHGDELNGIPTIHRLMRSLDPAHLCGTVIAIVVVNVPGFQRRVRGIDDRQDLNHVFPGRPHGPIGEVLAHRLCTDVLPKLDLLLDLHTASRGHANALYVRADMSHPRTARMAYLQRPRIIVHNPPSDGTLRGRAASMGIPAITVEIGDPQRFQRTLVERTTVGVRAVLADLDMVPRRAVALREEPILCASSWWTYTDRGGLLDVRIQVGELVEEGDVVATLADVFGHDRGSFTAPHSGVIIGHAVDPVATTGSRIVHLGRLATPEHTHVLRRDQVLDTP